MVLTPEIRQRQLHDEDMTGGSQPANIRVINRRINDPASLNDLEYINQSTSFKIENSRKAQKLFFIDKGQSYQIVCTQNLSAKFRW
jgi:hypothetical protein